MMMAMTMTVAMTIAARVHHISPNDDQIDFCVFTYYSHNDGIEWLLSILCIRTLKNENIQRCGYFNVNIFLIQFCTRKENN